MRKLILAVALLLPASMIGAGVTIDGPDSLEVKEADLFYVEGLTIEEFKQCAAYVRPEENKPQVLVLQTVNNLPVLYIKGRSAGTFDVILDVNLPDRYELVFHGLTIGGGDEDDENPPSPGQTWEIVIVHETNDRDNLPRAQQVMLGSLAFRDRLTEAGHKLIGIVDQHTTGADDRAPAEVVDFLVVCAGDPLPRICLRPTGGGEVKDFPLPATEEAVFELLDKGGAP